MVGQRETVFVFWGQKNYWSSKEWLFMCLVFDIVFVQCKIRLKDSPHHQSNRCTEWCHATGRGILLHFKTSRTSVCHTLNGPTKMDIFCSPVCKTFTELQIKSNRSKFCVNGIFSVWLHAYFIILKLCTMIWVFGCYWVLIPMLHPGRAFCRSLRAHVQWRSSLSPPLLMTKL